MPPKKLTRKSPKKSPTRSPAGKGTPADTRLALVKAAEKLFAERGVDAVSLREVSVAAGQHNNSAVGYHFGSREGLIDAILARHSLPIHVRYDAQLDLLERQGIVTLRALLETLVLPIVAKLDDPDGGWEYISVAAQLTVSPHLPLALRPVAQTPAVLRLISMILPFSRSPPEFIAFRFDRVVSVLYASIITWHRLTMDGPGPLPRSVFEHDLLDSLEQVISQPPSEETSRLLERALAAG